MINVLDHHKAIANMNTMKRKLKPLAKCGTRVTGQVWECALGDLCKLDDPIPYTLTEKGNNAVSS